MPAVSRGYRTALLASGALAAASIGYAVTALGVSPSEPASSCRASVVRVSLAGETVVEPIVANKDASPCIAQSAGVGTLPLAPVPIDLTLVTAKTSLAAPQAQAKVVDVAIKLSSFDPALPDITAQVLTSQASASCNNGVLSRTGSSRVVGLQIDGEGGEFPEGDAYQDVFPPNPLLRVQLNETDTSVPNTLTQRALHITALPGAADLDVVVSESSVDTTGNPCATTTTGGTTGGSTGGTTGGTPVVGWMNGGGQTGTTEVTHAFVLPCTLAQEHPGPNLVVEIPNVGKFRLTNLSEVSCSQVGTNLPEQPEAGFNTITGKGTGTCKSLKNVAVDFTFTDEGEPNQGRDKDRIVIGNPNDNVNCDLSVAGPTTNGNHQAHRGTNPPA